ncbi:MAG: DUF1844 domain-containing protein [Desulfatibacillum sp.]|nr:DUF1844 domain-containing protein [Desulfatibacillum sp.]
MTDDKGFEVRDRRFSTSQEPETEESVRKDAETAPGEPGAAEPKSEETQARREYRSAGTGPGQALPQVNFSTFVISLSSSVFMYLGEIGDPGTGEKAVNLPVARQTIDILAMLEEKTKGNLAEDESQLLRNVLYDLRMRYVALARK